MLTGRTPDAFALRSELPNPTVLLGPAPHLPPRANVARSARWLGPGFLPTLAATLLYLNNRVPRPGPIRRYNIATNAVLLLVLGMLRVRRVAPREPLETEASLRVRDDRVGKSRAEVRYLDEEAASPESTHSEARNRNSSSSFMQRAPVQSEMSHQLYLGVKRERGSLAFHLHPQP
jgi:hypothetical protein